MAGGPGTVSSLSEAREAAEVPRRTESRSSPARPGGTVQIASNAPGSRSVTATVPRVGSNTGTSPRRAAPCGATT